MSDYTQFVASKLAAKQSDGIGVSLDELNPILFRFQAKIVRWALANGRAAIFADCGLGKTFMQLEWARLVQLHTGKSVLIYAPLTVARQTQSEAKKLSIQVRHVQFGAQILEPGLYVTNYERNHLFEGMDLGGIVLDESAILKNATGKTRTALIEQAQSVPFRLCCTATPAPNDITEISSHSEFLGIKSRQEMLAHWFVHDDKGWRLKGHASRDFYRWMATWSVFLRDPSDIGEDATGYQLPALHVKAVTIESEAVPEGYLFQTDNLKGVSDRAAVRKSTVADRVEAAAALIEAEPCQAWICWTGLNTESDRLAARLKGMGELVVQVEGSTSDEDKIDRLERFIDGRATVLISKPRVAGFGLNLQHCSRQIFVGINDSMEQYYQCLRRSYRFGQTCPVQAYIVTTTLEASIVDNVMAKESEAKKMGDSIIENIGDLERKALSGGISVEVPPGHIRSVSGSDWTLHNGDCVDVMAGMADESVDLSVYSPPFATLYTYSDNPRDMGNCVNYAQFYQQFRFAIDHIFRITKPGRLTCVHLAQTATTLAGDGLIGLNDFRGAIIDAYKRAGFVHYREVCIDKCPQALKDGTAVMTPTGWHPIEGLKVGDLVVGQDGNPTPVVGVWPQGERPIYRVSFKDGSFVDCDAKHIWTVSNNGHGKGSHWNNYTTEYLLENGLTTPSGRLRWRIPNCEPVQFSQSNPLPIDPYTMGVLLGDGDISQERGVNFCSDREIADSLPLPARHSVTERANSTRASGAVATFGVVCQDWHQNDILNALRDYGLQGCRAWEKFIPVAYLHASVEDRWALLQGLLDTDGTVKNTGAICYSTTSFVLAQNIQFLVRSFGGNVTIKECDGSVYQYKGESRQGRTIYHLQVSPQSRCPFRLKRKAEKWTASTRDFRRVIASIEKLDEIAPCTCITVAALDGLFVTRDFVVTHNSQAIRTHSKALLFVQMKKDRSWSGPALADFICIFRKPGEPAVPIRGGVTNDEWIQWARPVWYGIRESDTLNVAEARSDKDERHIAPLQLPVIKRCVKLWSNPGELVFSPFAGIGSEGYQSLIEERRFVGSELKTEYFNVAIRNLRKAELSRGQQDLFSGMNLEDEAS